MRLKTLIEKLPLLPASVRKKTLMTDSECTLQPALMWLALLCLTFTPCVAQGLHGASHYSIEKTSSGYQLTAGIIQRQLTFGEDNLATTKLTVENGQLLARPANEVVIRVKFASPDRAPRALKRGEGGYVETDPLEAATNVLSVKESRSEEFSGVSWSEKVANEAKDGASNGLFCGKSRGEQWDRDGIHHLTVTGTTCEGSLNIAINYEVYDVNPAIRKWVQITNHSQHWLKLDRLMLEDFELSTEYQHATALTPSERGAGSSLVAMGDADGSAGVILGSEIPSALRNIETTGAMSYTDRYFEWVLGPGESFTSEPVFEYAYAGETVKTVSAISTSLDRTVEGPFQQFLRKRVGLLVDATNLPVPYYSTWSNFGAKIDDSVIREMAHLAAEAGFGIISIDDGWQRGRLGTEVDTTKFPDFASTVRYAQSQGLRVGLWVSSYRSPDSKDLRDLPDAASRPAIRREGGFGMSFASHWREYYAHDMATLAKQYRVTYFKQDFSNIAFGDLAEGHESRTVKESLLRGLRGLLQAEDLIRAQAPNLTLEITHEIYWGTPGVPCDLAVLKHVNLYHVPPNDYSGDGVRTERYNPQWKLDSVVEHRALLEGAFHARERFYAHRGLPLDAIEYYGAATMNFKGSLTNDVQDRQVASWLMGAPTVFAGDLSSLTKDNLAHYKARFAMLKQLQQSYNIYDYFEFSGVPSAPTDRDWQWWGKLNPEGYGAVVVLRGQAGADARAVNIPWVQRDRRYSVQARMTGKMLGQFSGKQLQDGMLHLSLPVYGQEILELGPIKK